MKTDKTDNETELTHIEFIAQLINQDEARKQGYTAPTRWLTLREDLQHEYLNKAKQMFESWRNEELEAKKNRDMPYDNNLF